MKNKCTMNSHGVAGFSISVGSERTGDFWLGSGIVQYPQASEQFRTICTDEHNIVAAYSGPGGGSTANDFPN